MYLLLNPPTRVTQTTKFRRPELTILTSNSTDTQRATRLPPRGGVSLGICIHSLSSSKGNKYQGRFNPTKETPGCTGHRLRLSTTGKDIGPGGAAPVQLFAPRFGRVYR